MFGIFALDVGGAASRHHRYYVSYISSDVCLRYVETFADNVKENWAIELTKLSTVMASCVQLAPQSLKNSN